jgi:hypothetical protein
MTAKELIQHRLSIQHLATPLLDSAADVVSWFGAVQAQDYLGSLWAIGQRMKHADETTVEKAISDRKIVRTWPMRGTLHFTTPENVRWMLKLLAPRVMSRAASVHRLAELDKKVFAKSAKVLEKALNGNEPLTRDELYTILERSKIATGNTRGLHILGYVAMQGLICFGPRKGKQPTFTLLDEWLPALKQPEPEEALAKLALIYFRSHGPATVDDFQWWTGLTKTEATTAISLVKSQLIQESFNDKTYWMCAALTSKKPGASTAYLLPAYDEYSVAYKDRSSILDETHAARAGNGIFSPCVIVDGKIAGTWKRTFEKDKVVLDMSPFKTFNKIQAAAVTTAAKRYSKFVGLPLKVKG